MGLRWCCSSSLKSNAGPELYKSIVAYDGTDFLGFQRQAAADRTVQGVLEAGLRTIGWEERSLRAAGRTDAGAHALGQVVSFRLNWRHKLSQLTVALNTALPRDVAVLRTEAAPAGFDPRFSASGRRYSYRLAASAQPDPFRERYGWRLWPAPELQRLEALAGLFVGRRDFGAFGRAPIEHGHTVREVRRADWTLDQDWMVFTIEADAYLYRMVRRIVGAMVQVSLGREDEGHLRQALADPQRSWNGRIAPARGLFLEQVFYEERRDEVAENLLSQT